MRKAYEEYVPFNDVWITNIPITWHSHKMKHLFCERSEKGYPHEQLLVASQNMGVVPKTIYGSRTVEAQKDLQLLKLVKIGDFVISLRSFEGGIEYAYYQGIISPAYTVLTTKEDIQKGYFRYLAKSTLFVKLLTLCVTGIREGQNIDYSKLKNHLLPVPPREEQEQIVRFLDWKVSSINKLINLKQQEINDLKELKKATISDAVTHGLDKTVPMKDSGISWLGKIPQHWEYKKINCLFLERKTKVSDKDYQPLSVTKSGILHQLTDAAKSSDSDNRKLVLTGDFVINSRSDRKGSCGISGLDGSVSLINIVLEPKRKLEQLFVHYLLRCQPFSEEYYRCGRGIVADLWTTRYSEMKSIFLPIPPRDEQDKTAHFLDVRCAEIDRLITENQAQITNLHDLKSSLIADVVTGQIDVRDVTIPNYETVQEHADEAPDTVENPLEADKEV